MTNVPEDERVIAHRLQMQAAGSVPLTVEEILAGITQAGVPRPSFLKDHEDDGTVETVAPLGR